MSGFYNERPGGFVVKKGDFEPPIQFTDTKGPISLETAIRVEERIQPIDERGRPAGDPWSNPAEIVDAARGKVRFPQVPPGNYLFEYRIDWPHGGAEVLPNAGPMVLDLLPGSDS